MKTVMRKFKTKNFTVVASIEPDDDLDLSWDEDGETRAKLESGEYEAFMTSVHVYYRGQLIGSDYLGGSIYSDPKTFFTDHRDPDPMNRNCTLMRAARGDNSVICHYFPGMVSEAIREARRHFGDAPKLRHVG